MNLSLPQRKTLIHDIPSWIGSEGVFFITVCTLPRGVNTLCHPRFAERIWDSLSYRQERKEWYIHLMLLMPDHLHTLASFPPTKQMTTMIRSWKRYLAKDLRIKWQRGFFDHRLRRTESLQQKTEYIIHNPVRSGLVLAPDDWPYIWRGTSI